MPVDVLMPVRLNRANRSRKSTSRYQKTAQRLLQNTKYKGPPKDPLRYERESNKEVEKRFRHVFNAIRGLPLGDKGRDRIDRQQLLMSAIGLTQFREPPHLSNYQTVQNLHRTFGPLLRSIALSAIKHGWHVYAIHIKTQRGNISEGDHCLNGKDMYDEVQRLLRNSRLGDGAVLLKTEAKIYPWKSTSLIISYHFHGILICQNELDLKFLNRNYEKIISEYDELLPIVAEKLSCEKDFDSVSRVVTYGTKFPVSFSDHFKSLGMKDICAHRTLSALLQLRLLGYNGGIRATGIRGQQERGKKYRGSFGSDKLMLPARESKETSLHRLHQIPAAKPSYTPMKLWRLRRPNIRCKCSFRSQVNEPDQICDHPICIKSVLKEARAYLEFIIDFGGCTKCEKLNPLHNDDQFTSDGP